MRYVKFIDSSTGSLCIGTGGCGGTEISKGEYNQLLAEIREKNSLRNKLYAGEIAVADVPAEWREEIQRDVDEWIELDAGLKEQDISADEALNIILGGEDA